jgi:hypothetical protein
VKRRAGGILTAILVLLLALAVSVPLSRAQVVGISKALLQLPKNVLSLSPRVQGSALPASSVRSASREQNQANGVIVGASYHNDTSPPLRDMKQLPIGSSRGGEREANKNPRVPSHHKDSPDEAVQDQHVSAPNMPLPILNFDGIPFPGVVCDCAPPDTDGAVGLTQYVQIVNEGYQVFAKTTGASVFGPSSIASVWSGFGGLCEFNGSGDPIALYDHLANRWLLSQFAVDSTTGAATDQCIAVSTTSDATGPYNRYGFHLGTNFFDYPKLGVWPDAYYMSDNVFDPAGTTFLGPQPFAFDRSAMLVGSPATFVSTTTPMANEDPFLPSDLDGGILPPAGAPNSFVEWPGGGTYKVYHFHADFVTPANSTFTLFASPAAAAFTQLTANVPEPNGDSLDSIGDRFMFRLAYRNFGDHESVVTNYTVSSGGVAGARWLELRNVTNGPVTVFQESTYQPDTTGRWMGSTAMDNAGNLALGFSVSSSSVFPGVRYAGRLAGDALNTLAQGEATLFAGAGSQSGTNNRWGDYSSMSVDPVDDCTFWYTNEYYPTGSTSFNWLTRIGNFKFPGCIQPTPTPTVTGSRTNTPTVTPTPTQTPTPVPPTPACALTEGFDNVTTLPGAGWAQINKSSPLGTTGWFQGDSATFTSQSGASNSYIAANFASGSGTATISNWLLTPPLILQNGAQLTFWTRTVSPPQFPDRLQVRMSLNGNSSDVGTTATSVGDFTTLLLDINPTYTTIGYPIVFTLETVTLSGIGAPTAGRLAFRYFVENGGPAGVNSDYIGIDTVQYSCGATTPTPTITPAQPTNTPTNTRTNTPTNTPTRTATITPINTQTRTPTSTPTSTPTQTPTITPTGTAASTSTPTRTPTRTPTNTPTMTPTNTPTGTPAPTSTPTRTPTNTPTNAPTVTPTNTPTGTPAPTSTPTRTPTSTPTSTPSVTPTNTPTGTATSTGTPTRTPTNTPTNTPTVTPTNTPTGTATSTGTPTRTPTNTPTNTPTVTPTNTPTGTPAGASLFTVSPCRLADTRNPAGPSGGPALSANTIRTFPVANLCEIPLTAKAVAVNLAVFQPTNGGDLRVYPAGGPAPLASAINFRTGIVRANNAVVPLGAGGQISVQCDMPSGSTHFFFDVYGYFQ